MPDKEVFELLGDKMMRYKDLIDVPVIDCREELVPIKQTDNLRINPIDPVMKQYTGDDIFIRSTVGDMLGQASLKLAETNNNLALEVVYGYRALSIQQNLFTKIFSELPEELSVEDQYEATHRMIAVPEVSGHPTGGAVDIQIVDAGLPLDFGSDIWEFSQSSYVFNPYINRRAWQNRQLLRRVMMYVGFAPFDGEWWHFSFGDRECAKFYDYNNAVYEQVEL